MATYGPGLLARDFFLPSGGFSGQLLQGQGACQHAPGNEEGAVLPGFHVPLDKGGGVVLDFNAGDAIGVHAASGVRVVRPRVAQHGAVGVSRDEVTIVLDRPGGEFFSLFCLRR